VLRDTSPDNSHEDAARANALASARVKVDPDKLDRIFNGRVRDNDDLRDCWREILPLYDYNYDPAAVQQRVDATPYRYEAHNYAFSVNIPGYDIKSALSSISCPALVTVGRTDWITPVDRSEAIASLVADSRLVIFEKSGHSPQIEEAEAWTRTVREFLAQVSPAPKNPAPESPAR
jgi:proline iminopeptidase